MIIMIGQGLAVCAGFCAAMAAVSAKLAMTSETTLGLCNLAMNLIAEVITLVYDIDWQRAKGISARDLLPACDTVLPFVRLVFLGLIFAFNAIMWTLFVKSLQKCSSIKATVTNTASNFFFTAVMGHVLFGETLSLLWWAGASLIIVGLLLVHKGSRSKDDSADKKKTL